MSKKITFPNFTCAYDAQEFIKELEVAHATNCPTELLSAIEEELKKVEGKCRERTFRNAFVLVEGFWQVAEHLEGLTNEDKEGMQIAFYSAAATFAKAYKFTPYCTRALWEFKRGKWHLMGISRWACPKKHCFEVVKMSERAKEKVLKLFLKF